MLLLLSPARAWKVDVQLGCLQQPSSFEGDEHPPAPPASLRASLRSFLALVSYGGLNLQLARVGAWDQYYLTAVDRASYSERSDAR